MLRILCTNNSCRLRGYGENNHFVIARRQMEQNSQQNNENPKN